MSLIDSIIGAESGGDPNARNPNSSASGAGQFIDSTWLDTIRSARPDLAQGKSDAELLALKTDPQLSRQMTEAYAAQNGATLSKAGHPVTPGNTYLAHFAGPQGAVSILNADPTAPVSSVLTPSAVRANPFLQGMTAGDLRSWADRKMGGAQPSPASPASPAIAPLAAIPQPSAPIFAPQPQQQAQQSEQEVPAFAQIPQMQGQPIFSLPKPQQAEQGAVPLLNLPAQQMAQAPPIFASPQKHIDLSKLKAALASGNRGLFLGRG